jgi:plastocyanin
VGLSILKCITLGAVLCGTVQAAELHVSIKNTAGKPVPDAVVLAVPVDPKNAQHAQLPGAAVDQVDKQFVPYVKPIFVGSTLRFPNSDNIKHQVYSFSPAKKFELPLYAGQEAQSVLFDKPGVVVLGCNIHDWMVGYIYVSETPFFAKTDAAGSASLKDLPPGEYRVRIWHPEMAGTEESTLRTAQLSAEAPASESWRIGVKAAIHAPRLSGGGSSAYP